MIISIIWVLLSVLMQVRIDAPDTVLTVATTYHDIFSGGEETGVPDGTRTNLYRDGLLVASDTTQGGVAYFEAPPGNYLVDTVLGRADRYRLWVCRDGVTVKETSTFLKIECEAWFFLFYPFILPGNASP